MMWFLGEVFFWFVWLPILVIFGAAFLNRLFSWY